MAGSWEHGKHLISSRNLRLIMKYDCIGLCRRISFNVTNKILLGNENRKNYSCSLLSVSSQLDWTGVKNLALYVFSFPSSDIGYLIPLRSL